MLEVRGGEALENNDDDDDVRSTGGGHCSYLT